MVIDGLGEIIGVVLENVCYFAVRKGEITWLSNLCCEMVIKLLSPTYNNELRKMLLGQINIFKMV